MTKTIGGEHTSCDRCYENLEVKVVYEEDGEMVCEMSCEKCNEEQIK